VPPQTAGNNRNHKIIPVWAGKSPADTVFGQTIPIKGCGVDIADTGVKCRLNCTLGIRFGHLLKQIADRGRTKAKARDIQV